MPNLKAAISIGCFLLLSQALFAAPSLYERLIEANVNWRPVDAAEQVRLSVPTALHEQDLLKKHLSLVETALRARDTSSLSPQARAARLKNMDYLHDYWTGEASPINTVLPYRNPVFIDAENRICAVGYLMKRGGAMDLARALSKLNNTIYVRDIKLDAFDSWVSSSGLTVDELAWIQPAYGPQDAQQWSPIGSGIQGTVRAIAVDEARGRTYAGGTFNRVAGSTKVQNIAAFNGQSWEGAGGGVRGEVRALLMDQGLLYVGGKFDRAGKIQASNVAVWDPARKVWKNRGGGLGAVESLIHYKGSLYAGSSSPGGGSFLSRWNGGSNKWEPIASVNGAVRAMKLFGGRLVIAGDFTEADGQHMNHVASFDGADWQPLAEGIPQSVRAMAVFKDRLFFGSVLVTKPKAGSGTCDVSVPSWTGQAFEPIPVSGTEEDCKAPDVKIATMEAAGDSLAFGYEKSGGIGFIVQENDGTFRPFSGFPGETMTGLGSVQSILIWKKQIFVGGRFDSDRAHYIGGGSSIVSGKQVMRYFNARSGFNRIDFSKQTEDTFFTPYRALHEIKLQ